MPSKEIYVRFLKIFVLYTLLCSKWLSSYLAETTFITPAHRQVVCERKAYEALILFYVALIFLYVVFYGERW